MKVCNGARDFQNTMIALYQATDLKTSIRLFALWFASTSDKFIHAAATTRIFLNIGNNSSDAILIIYVIIIIVIVVVIADPFIDRPPIIELERCPVVSRFPEHDDRISRELSQLRLQFATRTVCKFR